MSRDMPGDARDGKLGNRKEATDDDDKEIKTYFTHSSHHPHHHRNDHPLLPYLCIELPLSSCSLIRSLAATSVDFRFVIVSLRSDDILKARYFFVPG